MRFYLLLAGVLMGVFFVSSSALAAGWIQKTSGTTLDLYSLDHSAGFGVITANGSSVLISHDQGKTWSSVAVGFGSYFGVDTVSSETGIIVGTSGKIYKTIDAGGIWTQKSSGTTETLRAVDMYNPTFGFAVGDLGKILRTSTGGETWSPMISGTMNSLYDVTTISTTTAWAVGNGGKILRTTNGGTTWTPQTSGTASQLRTVDAISAMIVFAGAANGNLYRTTDGGGIWTEVDIPGVSYIQSLDFYSTTHGIMTTGTGLYETTDGGLTWNPATPLDPFPTSVAFAYVLDYSGTTNRWAVGYSGLLYQYDGLAPTAVVGLSVLTGTTDNTPTFSWTASTDGQSDVQYELSIDGGAYSNVGGATTTTLGVLSDGSHTVSVRSADEAQNYGTSASVTFSLETSGPSVGLVTPAAATINVPVVLQVIPTDVSGVTSCTLTVNGVSQGAMSSAGGVFSRTHTFTSSGTATASATCVDGAGNSGAGPDTTITISAGADTTAPTVGGLSPTSATAGAAVTFLTTVSDNVAVSTCNLYIGGVNQGGMSVSGGTASVSYTFATGGTYAAYAQCTDAAGNSGTGLSTSVIVASAAPPATQTNTNTAPETTTPNTNTTTTQSPTSEAQIGDLVKTACSAGASVNDPCKAIYFLASDGKRHAFPHEKVFFTWYADFDGIVTISQNAMSSIPLGRNVTYRPGARMVKFVTSNTVYAVAQGGVLRPIESEAVAIELYGTDWNKKIDDISDAFYGNYTFGSSVAASASFDRNAEFAGVQTISDNL